MKRNANFNANFTATPSTNFTATPSTNFTATHAIASTNFTDLDLDVIIS